MVTLQTKMGGLAALVACLALAGCGDVGIKTDPGTLTVASVPTAEIFVDGTSHGTTPATIQIAAGSHEVKLVREYFTPFEATVDVGAGATSGVDAVLRGSDPTDPLIIAALAEALADDDGIAYEPFEDPPRHRGRPKESLVRLLWPQEEIRKEGLKTFCLEATLDYMGDGFITFKKGRKVLYRAAFEPDYEITVAEIPPIVREALKTNDTVTWGVTFDDRRKPVTTKFKVVRRPKVERKLAKLEKNRNFLRMDDVTQQILRAEVLQHYRLYSESLVEHLAIHQANPDSVTPYQGIVKALRRLEDGDETSLWRAVLPEVGGGGMYARRPAREGATPGTTVPQPGVPGPTVPTPAAPQPGSEGAGARPLRPGDQAPAPHLALWIPHAGARPEAVPVVPTAEPPVMAPTPSGEREGVAVPEETESAQGAFRERLDRTAEEDSRARAEVDAATEAAQQAAEAVLDAERSIAESDAQAHEALQDARAAREAADAAQDAAGAAQEAADADPTVENLRLAAENGRLAEEAEARANETQQQADVRGDEARRQAEEADRTLAVARERADAAEQQRQEAERHARQTADALAQARREAEENGVAVGPLPTDQPGVTDRDPLPQLANERRAAVDAAREVVAARQQYEALRAAADETGDPWIREQMETAQENLGAAEQAAHASLRAYEEAGGSGEVRELIERGGEDTEPTVSGPLAARVEATVLFEEAKRAADEAQAALDVDPDDPVAQENFRAAETLRADAEAHLQRLIEEYDAKRGD